MDIPKLLYNLASPLLKLNKVIFFLFIVFFIVINFKYNSFPVINIFLTYIGRIIVCCWIYAIGYASNEKLLQKGMTFREFRYFNWTFIVIAISFLTIYFTTTKTSARDYAEPLIVSIPLYVIAAAAYIYAIHLAAKALMMAELNRKTKIGEVGQTSVMMWVPAIGVWFIQPRIQALLKEA